MMALLEECLVLTKEIVMRSRCHNNVAKIIMFLSSVHNIKWKLPKHRSESSLRQLILPDSVDKGSCLRDETEL